MAARADVHIHSRFSDRPSEWILRRIGSPESFVEPLAIYRQCRALGMNFVTISDHNCIAGALEIGHLEGTFISSEITTYFPDDECKIHCLVLGITEEQFAVIQHVRESIYDFCDYIEREGIIASLAHPLFRVNDRLTVAQVEKLILLFNRFEAINGTRDPRACDMATTILRGLVPADIERLADRHGIQPVGLHPWKKSFTAGSDDHCGLYMARAFTVTPPAANVDEFLDHLRREDHQPGGLHGTSLQLAHSFYQIAASYYESRLLAGGRGRPNILGEVFSRLLDAPVNERSEQRGLGGKLGDMLRTFHSMRPAGQLNPAEQQVLDEMAGLFSESQRTAESDQRLQPRDQGARDGDDQRVFRLACDVSEKVTTAFVAKCLGYVFEGRFLESLQTLASLGPVAMAVAPYLAAFQTQHKDEKFLQQVAAHFPAARGMCRRGKNRAWVTDTFHDVNGVGQTVRMLARMAADKGEPLEVVTCLEEAPQEGFPVHNFTPLYMFPLPEYPSQMLSAPPFLRVVEYLERQKLTEVLISTPGPLGLATLAAAKLLKLRTIGLYHTDWPRYVESLTGDVRLEGWVRSLIRWFYSQMELVLVPSRFYLDELVSEGWPAEQLRLLPRGVDRARFHPGRREDGYWSRYGLAPGFCYMYSGRLSQEKNVELLLEAFARVAARSPDARLVLAGDGPARDELQARFDHPHILFTGWLSSDDVASACANADAFVFPSTTDTFGNSVLEALACGLPAIVTTQGGPQEIIARRNSGLIVEPKPESFAAAMIRLAQDRELYDQCASAALATAADLSWEQVFEGLRQSLAPPVIASSAADLIRRPQRSPARV